ncbi:Protein of unknown function [Mucilaginibacter lappiensis]|uniref:DUF2750 domain-containing protein n=1 Tax=Mucilaginibacter lappiensis TaxID=354630 RepID=A0ABR6PRV6_9SPHI|nr:DUF2750 domain-containing protein [Mucilaginibacter lappiensis]MBB6112519.1 hypothetical protein [Mucilaginibacter lappiensis]SIS02645.1 Protein of unknown function [Mucilaginibacter lappiensis]
MLQDIATTESKYKLFIEKVAASKLVWALKSKNGWANSHSNDSEDVDVIPFWSDRAYAKLCARDDWKGYLPVEIPLAEFLESWCIEMADNEVLAGINWDVNMFGKESTALNVALDILEQLNAINSAISFKNYNSINEFITEISESLD